MSSSFDKEIYDEYSSEGCLLKTSNVSWASLLEEELSNNEIIEHDLSTSQTLDTPKQEPDVSPNTVTNTVTITISNILDLEYKKENDIDILKHQATIANYLRRTIIGWSKMPVEISRIIPHLQWLQSTTAYMSQKLNLPISNKRIAAHVTVKSIPRASYQFCKDKHECEFNYDKNKHDGCVNQHFVHNLVNEDITTLLQYLQSAKSDQLHLIDWSQVKKSVETILFVFNHMSAELTNIEYYYPGKSNELHREKKSIRKQQIEHVKNFTIHTVKEKPRRYRKKHSAKA